MSPTSTLRGRFAHRANCDETFDSICPMCFRTVGQARYESSLETFEQAHVCDISDLVRFHRLQYATELKTVQAH